jgi:hypothetical protein
MNDFIGRGSSGYEQLSWEFLHGKKDWETLLGTFV